MADMDSLVLQINKVVTSVDNDRVEYNARERGKVLDVKIIGTDQVAYDLTGKHFRFVENKDGGKVVIDDEADKDNAPDGAGKFTRVDDKNGEFQYEYSRYIYQASGEAWFEVYSDSDQIDTTQKFYIDIENGTLLDVQNDNYISSLQAEIASYKATNQRLNEESDTQLNALKAKIQQSENMTDKAKSDAIAAINEAKNTATTTLNNLNGQYNSYLSKYQALESQINNDRKTINDNATAEINSIKSDWSKQTGNIDSDYKKQMQSVIADVQAKRDAALKTANDNFSAKLASLQSDYDSWKTKTVKDFNDTVNPIKAKIDQNAADLSDVSKTMSQLKQQLAMINFNDFVHKADVYTKQEIDDKVDAAGKVKKVDGIQPDAQGNINLNALPKGGGNMNEHSTISWNGNGSGTAKDGNLGGLGWSGSTDWAKIYGDNNGGNNIDLAFDLCDDGSNHFSYRVNGKEVSAINSDGRYTGTVDWTNVNGRPDDQINQLKGRKTVDAPDFNTLTDTGVYYVVDTDKGKNFPISNWGTLIVSSGNGNRIFQIYVGDQGGAVFMRDAIGATWHNWNQVAWKGDTADKSQVNVASTLFRMITKADSWNDILGVNNGNPVLISIRDESSGGNTLGNFSSAVVFGGGDTKGVLNVAYSDHWARIIGGNGSAPVWHEDIAWKSDITNLSNQVQAQSSTINDLKNKVSNLTPFTIITQAQID